MKSHHAFEVRIERDQSRIAQAQLRYPMANGSVQQAQRLVNRVAKERTSLESAQLWAYNLDAVWPADPWRLVAKLTIPGRVTA